MLLLHGELATLKHQTGADLHLQLLTAVQLLKHSRDVPVMEVCVLAVFLGMFDSNSNRMLVHPGSTVRFL